LKKEKEKKIKLGDNTMSKKKIVFLALACSLLCFNQLSMPFKIQTKRDIKGRKIIDTWKLISLDFRATNGKGIHPLGKDAAGRDQSCFWRIKNENENAN
jgi:hypothetical protein